MILLECNKLVAQKVYSSINKQAEELCKIFIEMEYFYQQHNKYKLRNVGQRKGHKKEQYLRAGTVLFCIPVKRKYPVLAPQEVIGLSQYIGSNIGYEITYIAYMHK